MKISVITPVFNAEKTIRSCVESVLSQTYEHKEYVVVDGASTDGTVEILKKYPIKWISEKDSGLYDAFNKGILLSTGDIVCFLCADDLYAHKNVLKQAADVFASNPDADIVYGDIVYVDRNDLSIIKRYWKSAVFKPGMFKKGWLPPNTALFIRRSLLIKHGLFNLQYKLASDYEMQYRLFEKQKLKSVYTPGIMVKMRHGGVSNAGFSNMYKSLKECYDALKSHKVKFPSWYILNTIIYRLRQVIIPSYVKKQLHNKS